MSSQQAEGGGKTDTAQGCQLLFPRLFSAVTCLWFRLLDLTRKRDVACIEQSANLAWMVPEW